MPRLPPLKRGDVIAVYWEDIHGPSDDENIAPASAITYGQFLGFHIKHANGRRMRHLNVTSSLWLNADGATTMRDGYEASAIPVGCITRIRIWEAENVETENP